MNYCNLVVLGQSASALIDMVMTEHTNRVTSNWYSRVYDDQTKLNLYQGLSEEVMWNQINGILLVANLSDPGVIETLEKDLKSLGEKSLGAIMIIGYYDTVSPMNEAMRIKVLEWAVLHNEDWVVLAANDRDVWNDIIEHFM